MGRLYDRLQFASDKVARAFFQLTIIIDIPSKVSFKSVQKAGAMDSGATQLPQQAPTIAERTNRTLLKIIRANLNTQYAAQAPTLSAFRDAVAAHGGTDVDATLLADFRAHIPLSNYDCYKPFVEKFHKQPCKKEEVENLLASGLPEFIAASSATTGPTPKILPKYSHRSTPPRCTFFSPDSENPVAAVTYCGCMDLKEIAHQCADALDGKLKMIRAGCPALALPYYAVPWAATIIGHLPSFLTIHGLFFLARRNIDRFYVSFTTLLVDLIRHVDEKWDTLLSCIKDGVLPDLEGIDHVRAHLQAQFYADPERAEELSKIGPPSSTEGWAHHVWPEVKEVFTICTGPFGNSLPKVRSVLGPNISLRCTGYSSSEATIGVPHNVDKLEEFVLQGDDVIEFLDFSQDDAHENIRQAWEVEVGKQYEPILTTRDGLWRYQIGDLLTILEFSAQSNSPIFKFAGRKSLRIHLSHTQITEPSLLEAIKAVNSGDTIKVQEFTTVLDGRTLPPTVGFFVELMGSVGQNAHQVPQQLFDALVATDSAHQRAPQPEQIRLPTVRIVEAGTFSAFRDWRRQIAKTNSGQIKVPLVLVNPTAQEWISKRVVQEL